METDPDSVEIEDSQASFKKSAVRFIFARSYRLWLLIAILFMLGSVCKYVLGVPPIIMSIVGVTYAWWFFKAWEEFVYEEGVSGSSRFRSG